MATDFLCPFCHARIPAEDVNVATDIALCRACGRTAAFSVVSGSEEVSLDCLNNPPRNVRMESDFGGPITITYRRISLALLFLVPFTAFWSGFSMYGIYGTQIIKGEFDLHKSLFGIPFLIGTVILLSIIVFLLLGKWVVTLDRGEGSVFVGVGPIGRTRRFTYNRDTTVSMRMTQVRVNQQPQKGILVRTDKQDFVFGTLIKEESKRFIAAAIMQQVAQA